MTKPFQVGDIVRAKPSSPWRFGDPAVPRLVEGPWIITGFGLTEVVVYCKQPFDWANYAFMAGDLTLLERGKDDESHSNE